MDALREESWPHSLSVHAGQFETQHCTANTDSRSISIVFSSYKYHKREGAALKVVQKKLCNALDTPTERCEPYKKELKKAKREAGCITSSAESVYTIVSAMTRLKDHQKTLLVEKMCSRSFSQGCAPLFCSDRS